MFIPYSEDIKRGDTILHVAAKTDNLSVVKENLHLVGKYNHLGETALSLALSNSDNLKLEIVRTLNEFYYERVNRDG